MLSCCLARATARAATACKAGAVLGGWTMGFGTDVPLAIARFISLEVLEWRCAAGGQRAGKEARPR